MMKRITTNKRDERRAESRAQAVAGRRAEQGRAPTIVRKRARYEQERRWKEALHDHTERGWFEQQVCREAA